MFGLITRAEHDRTIADLMGKLSEKNAAIHELRTRLSKVHTTRDGSGRYTKSAQEGAEA